MPKWTDYTIKANPADKDEVMILDTAGKANKRLGLSALSDWIIGKIANKVFENLQTQNKTILGALNELNSKTFSSKTITSLSSEMNTQFIFSVTKDIIVGDVTIPTYTKGIIIAYTDAIMIGVLGNDISISLYLGYRSQNIWRINCLK